MYNPDLLKETFKRSNPTENAVLCTLIDKFPDMMIIKGKDIPSVNWCMKKLKGKNVLILDAVSSNLTEKGHYKKIEFCLINKGKQIWIDAKQCKTTTNITDLHGEYHRAKNNGGYTLFIVEGNGYTKTVIKSHKEYLKRMYGNTDIDVLTLTEFQQNFN